MKERIFIQRAKEHVELKEFLKKFYASAKCSEIDVQHTPIMTRIVIYTTTPGLVIGSGGERIREAMEELKKRFRIENPQIDVQRVLYPDLDPAIVAQSIASSIENGVSYKRLGNYHIEKIMRAGAVGCEIVLSGKFSGQRGRRARFKAGYIKKSGHTAETNVVKGSAVATPKLGNIGVTVKIMLRMSDMLRLKQADVQEADENESEEAGRAQAKGASGETEGAQD